MLKRVAVSLLLALLIAGAALSSGQTEDQTEGLKPCDFVAKFKIVNRSTQITLEDIPFIEKLIWRNSKDDEAINELRKRIETYGPITKIGQLTGLEKFDGSRYSQAGENRAFLVRLFYALEGDEVCMVSSVQTSSSSLDQGSEELTLAAVYQRVIALESQVEELQDQVEELTTRTPKDVQYKVINLRDYCEEILSRPCPSGGEFIQDLLNRYAKEGWELVAVERAWNNELEQGWVILKKIE